MYIINIKHYLVDKKYSIYITKKKGRTWPKILDELKAWQLRDREQCILWYVATNIEHKGLHLEDTQLMHHLQYTTSMWPYKKVTTSWNIYAAFNW